LDTIVVKVNFIHKFDGGDAWVLPTDPNQNPPAQLSLKYKFYVDGESGCQSVPDGYRQFREADGGIDPAKTYYVVISNIDDDGIYDYTIGFELWPVPPS
jgi:hypothetical protein